ncbi:dipeptidyl-peptidase 5 [Blastomyces gilchristii SLH14081]|uniref:Dipeptidyl-peptidase V n=1 Tax=Blastomyces gilchristii (strain SLH14081) TaxID=559298 RepID=A0A179UA66_BLAGS|nr:dipeptidyl-peptidase 5 [Blastomyces gilchristii SLH14081]OAT04613.1 dipeptidyl-peptidase 5 [Blastomyces gilchristii SLH14081]
MAILSWLSAAALMSSALAMTPEQFISAPRRAEAIPNPSGKLAVFHVSQYSFEKHDTIKNEWNLLDLKTGDISLLTDDGSVSEILWLPGDRDGHEILYVNSTSSEVPGGVDLWTSDVRRFERRRKVASFNGPLQGFKAVKTRSGDIKFVAYGQSTSDGKLYNKEQAEKRLSSARIYDSLYPRHWDYWLTTEFNAVFSGTLERRRGHEYTFDGKLNNLVAPVKYAESPGPPFGGAGDYDLSPDGKTVAFMSKAPELPKANLTTSYIFIVPHDGSSVAIPINGPESSAAADGIVGASSSPVFSPDSKKIAYLQMEERNYESDRRIVYIATLDGGRIVSLASKWDRSPDSLKWTPDGKTLYMSVEDRARGRLFTLPTDAGADYVPENFTDHGIVRAYHFLKDSTSVLTTATTLWSNAIYTIASPDNEPKVLFSANEHDPELKGLGPEDIDEFYYDGNWTKVHAWIVKPEGFCETKKYPLAFLIHGGPQGSWGDSWSTRWNPKVIADQGYVVVALNPTGSTGFGEEFCDRIQNDWGGAPYDDLVKGWEYIKENFKYIDTDNAVALGASYGGFMVNWIQGMPFGRKFKALVSHDGTFVAAAKIATEELWFMEREFNGTFWEARKNFERFDPSAPENILQFATPMLVIHSDLDYRLAVAEGLSLFNILQERGVPSRFLNFPDENHWVLSKENSLVWHQQVLGWVNKYSGIEASNPDAVKLTDTVVPVVDIDAGPNI